MNKNRRSFVFKAVVGITGFMAGCLNSDQSGTEPTTQMTNSDSQPASKTVTQTSTSHSESSPTVPSTTDSTQSSSDCRMTASQKGEAAPPDFGIENVTDKRQTIRITATRLPENMTARPPENAPYEPRDLSVQPIFSRTIELPAGGFRVFRCTGMEDDIPRNEFQLKIAVQNGPTGVFDWSRNTAMLDVTVKASSIEFSVSQGQ